MSSNSLSAAKRRRVGLPNQMVQNEQLPSPPNRLSGQLFNSRVSTQNSNAQPRINPTQNVNKNVGNQKQVLSSTQSQKVSNVNNNNNKNVSDYVSDENINQGFHLLPNPPPGLNINQILSTHHLYVNKMASDFSLAIDELGNTFNELSSNCDNLNERLTGVEDNIEETVNNVLSNSNSNSSNDDYVRLNNNVEQITDKLNSFTRDLNELKELKLIILKNQGLLMDNTLNIKNVKKSLCDLEDLTNKLSNRMSSFEERESSSNQNVSSSTLNSGEDEFVSNSLADSLNNILLNKNTDECEDNGDDVEDLESENINLHVYDN